MQIRLDGKKVIVTGGTRGIGRAVAIACAEVGADVLINYSARDDAARSAKDAIEKLGRKCVVVKGDAAEVAVGAKLVKTALDKLGGADILINNAAVSHNTPFLMLEPEEWHRAVRVNIDTLYTATLPFLRHLIGKKIKGHVLNVTSVCGVRPVAAVPVHYAMTKAAIVGFTYTLAKEVGRYGICVNAIAPGLIETAFSRNLPEERQEDFKRFCPMARIGTPEEVAKMALFMLSEHNTYMTGETVVISGGL